MKATVFIYTKEDKVKVLDMSRGTPDHNKLIEQGYAHVQTIDAAIWLQYQFDNNMDKPTQAWTELKSLLKHT